MFLYYRPQYLSVWPQIRNIQKNKIFVASSGPLAWTNKHTSLLTEALHYGSVMFYTTGPSAFQYGHKTGLFIDCMVPTSFF